ncbi:tlp [Palpita vitrealis nucleopolyhedrovirus]|uniref:Tlp n=1 Tax=Palpita vitrealis nucleopolyhedrovirus TaxID=2951960 RepID=A0AAE9LNI4_9ABAC|nr:tlp [Palpita vitrealis nucleopolyhedrovirus]
MATTSNTTLDIIVNAQINKKDANVLDFIIEDEYYLKKRGVGAHVIKVSSSPQLKLLYKNAYSTVSCGNYGILCNLVQNGEYDLNAIMFNCAEIKLNKDDVLFQVKIWQQDKTDLGGATASSKQIEEVENGDGIEIDNDDDERNDDTVVGEFNVEENVEDEGAPTPKKQKLDSVEQN